MTLYKLICDRLENLDQGDPLPRRGAAIRPDLAGQPVLYDDTRPLGCATQVYDCKDYTAREHPEYVEVLYDTTPAASRENDRTETTE